MSAIIPEVSRTKLVLVVNVESKQKSTIKGLLGHDSQLNQAVAEHPGVVVMSENSVLLDEVDAHSILIRLCALLQTHNQPYFLVYPQKLSSLACGKLQPKLQSLLAKAQIAMTPISILESNS